MSEGRSIRAGRRALVMFAPLVTLACGGGGGPAQGAAAALDAARSVENPALVRALAVRETDRPIRSQVALVLQLNAAKYLVPRPAGPDPRANAVKSGQPGAPVGQGVRLLTVTDENGRGWLPLFTDSRSLRAWTTQEVRPLVQEAATAWRLALSDRGFAGVIINPGSDAVRLDRPTLQLLRQLSIGSPPAPRDVP